MVEIAPDHPCDRCDHPSKYHAGPDRGSVCMVVAGRVFRGERIPKGLRAKQCLCDGYFPAP
jgi:hypothetical protein